MNAHMLALVSMMVDWCASPGVTGLLKLEGSIKCSWKTSNNDMSRENHARGMHSMLDPGLAEH